MAKERIHFYLTLVTPPDLSKLQLLALMLQIQTELTRCCKNFKAVGCHNDVERGRKKQKKTLPAVALEIPILSLMKMIALSLDMSLKNNILQLCVVKSSFKSFSLIQTHISVQSAAGDLLFTPILLTRRIRPLILLFKL